MPIYPKQTLPEWADPTQESVTSPLWKTLVRKAVHLSGADDPASSVMQAATPAVSPLISIYKDAAARSVGTDMFRAAANRLGPRFGNAGRAFAAQYPRVAAHINLLDKPSSEIGFAAGGTRAPIGKVTDRIPMVFSHVGHSLVEDEADPIMGAMHATDFINHEGTHVAQSLGNANFKELYHGANKVLGYGPNPFEQVAREAGDKAVTGLGPATVGGFRMNAIERLKALLTPVHGVEQFVEPGQAETAARMKSIIDQRAEMGWKPTR